LISIVIRSIRCIEKEVSGQMRKAGLPVLVLAATVLCVRFSAGQDSGQDRPHTDTLVKIPAAPNHEFDYAQVMVDGFTRKVYPGDDAHFELAAGLGDQVSVKVTLVRSGFGEKEWDKNAVLNGSGHVDYIAALTGTGIFSQWPLVTFTASAHLDVWIDNALARTTDFSKGLAPDRDHRVEWRNGNSKVCTTTINVPVNVTRSYKCNSVTGKIENP
jgi:hypothetical protein